MFTPKFQSRVLDNDTVQRIGDVLMIASQHNDYGVIDWGARAIADADTTGKLRNRDVETLERLERTYNRDFYRNECSTSGRVRHCIYA